MGRLSGAACEWTAYTHSHACGIVGGVNCDVTGDGNIMVNWKLRWAVAAWLSDAARAEAILGHISTWDTSRVTDMRVLFSETSAPFNEDIGAWDTSGVKTMNEMFVGASAFDQDIGGWDTSGVTTHERHVRRSHVF